MYNFLFSERKSLEMRCWLLTCWHRPVLRQLESSSSRLPNHPPAKTSIQAWDLPGSQRRLKCTTPLSLKAPATISLDAIASLAPTHLHKTCINWKMSAMITLRFSPSHTYFVVIGLSGGQMDCVSSQKNDPQIFAQNFQATISNPKNV